MTFQVQIHLLNAEESLQCKILGHALCALYMSNDIPDHPPTHIPKIHATMHFYTGCGMAGVEKHLMVSLSAITSQFNHTCFCKYKLVGWPHIKVTASSCCTANIFKMWATGYEQAGCNSPTTISVNSNPLFTDFL